MDCDHFEEVTLHSLSSLPSIMQNVTQLGAICYQTFHTADIKCELCHVA